MPWESELMHWALKFIDTLGPKETSAPVSQEIVDLMESIFITRDTNDLVRDRYSRLIMAIADTDADRQGKTSQILGKLRAAFPNEPHFRGHYARRLGYDHRFQEALVEIDIALEQDHEDGTLWHIKGMIFRGNLFSNINKLKRIILRGELFEYRDLDELFFIEKAAGDAFAKARQYSSIDKLHGYISHLQMINESLSFGHVVYNSASGEHRSFGTFIMDKDYDYHDYYVSELNLANTLLMEVKSLQPEQTDARLVKDIEDSLDYLMLESIEQRIGFLKNIIRSTNDASATRYRRALTDLYWTQAHRSWENWPEERYVDVVEMMERNLERDPKNINDLRLWFNTLRRISSATTEQALFYLENWYNRSKSYEPAYYLSIIYTVRAIEDADDQSNNTRLAQEYLRFLRNFAAQASGKVNQVFPYNCFSKKYEGLKRIVYFEKLGKLEGNFFPIDSATHHLSRVTGTILPFDPDKPAQGRIQLEDCGLHAFFVPGEPRRSDGLSFSLSDVSKRVEFFLAFSYSGLRTYFVDFVGRSSTPNS